MKKLKLVQDYVESANLEVEYSEGKWARVTSRQFRSFLGPRRVDGVDYVGLVFYEGTNYPYVPKEDDARRAVSIQELNDKRLITKHSPKSLNLFPSVSNRY